MILYNFIFLAVLAAGAPEVAPFMADEVLWAMPDIEGIDYTMKEYLKLVEKTKACVERLNSQGSEKPFFFLYGIVHYTQPFLYTR